jgi:hypothetical protein
MIMNEINQTSYVSYINGKKIFIIMIYLKRLELIQRIGARFLINRTLHSQYTPKHSANKIFNIFRHSVFVCIVKEL